MRRTKIIATAGPSLREENKLREAILSGVDVFRINLAHGTQEEHRHLITLIRKICNQTGRTASVLVDLAGPKIRARIPHKKEIRPEEGRTVLITGRQGGIATSEQNQILVDYPFLGRDVLPGHRVLIDDGKIVLRVISSGGDALEAEVIQGGVLRNDKGVNFPDSSLSVPALTEKDIADVDFALQMEVDWIALSFVRKKEDIFQLQNIVRPREPNIKIIAKIEKPEAVNNADEILQCVDGIMIARGDLGVEMDLSKIPIIQSRLIEEARKNHKVSIVATQVMESMVENLLPRRAEVTDVATAIREGADALMLSNETSVGKHPIEVIRTVSRIIEEVETHEPSLYYRMNALLHNQERFVSERICYSAVELARVTGAAAIVTMTFTGYSAFVVSSFRPAAKIFAFTPNPRIIGALNMVWGVRAFFYDKFISTDHTIRDVKAFLLKHNLVGEKDLLIHIASMPVYARGPTNMLKLEYAGDL